MKITDFKFLGDSLQMVVPGQDSRRRFRAQAGTPGMPSALSPTSTSQSGRCTFKNRSCAMRHSSSSTIDCQSQTAIESLLLITFANRLVLGYGETMLRQKGYQSFFCWSLGADTEFPLLACQS